MLLCVTQVEPVQWSADHTRVVLSSAITSPTPLCTPPMIEAARLAVQEGYEGTMHRYVCNSQLIRLRQTIHSNPKQLIGC